MKHLYKDNKKLYDVIKQGIYYKAMDEINIVNIQINKNEIDIVLDCNTQSE